MHFSCSYRRNNNCNDILHGSPVQNWLLHVWVACVSSKIDWTEISGRIFGIEPCLLIWQQPEQICWWRLQAQCDCSSSDEQSTSWFQRWLSCKLDTNMWHPHCHLDGSWCAPQSQSANCSNIYTFDTEMEIDEWYLEYCQEWCCHCQGGQETCEQSWWWDQSQLKWRLLTS